MKLYLNSTYLRALLKNEIGCSNPSELFYKSIATIVSSDANEKVIKSYEKSGLART